MKITVDASVVIKWLVVEERREEARAVLGHRIERHAPDFVLVECANVLWKKVRRGEIAAPDPLLEALLRLADVVVLHPTASLLASAVASAGQLDHPVYDCLYVACAEQTDSALLTDDQKLARRALGRLPPSTVLSLGDPSAVERLRVAATGLVIDDGRLEEIIEASRMVEQTQENLADTTKSARQDGLPLVDMAMVVESPSSRRLRRLVQDLSREERIDLLALGWFEEHGPAPNWEYWFNYACTRVDSLGARYFTGFDWARGLALLKRERDMDPGT